MVAPDPVLRHLRRPGWTHPGRLRPHALLLETLRRGPRRTLFPYTTLFRSDALRAAGATLVEVTLPPSFGVLHAAGLRSEEHTSELQSHSDIVWRPLLEKKRCFISAICRA